MTRFGLAKILHLLLSYSVQRRMLESRLNSRAILGVTHPTPLLLSNLKFSMPVYLEQCLGYLNVCKGMKSSLKESGLFRTPLKAAFTVVQYINRQTISQLADIFLSE